MTLSVETRRDYEIGGMRLAVWSGRADLLQALERRLMRYGLTEASEAPHLELHYVDDLRGTGSAPMGGSTRVVYEPGGGIVRHDPDTDRLHAEVGGVSMHSDLKGGITHVAGGAWSGAQRYVAAHTLTTLVLMEAFKRHGRFALHAGCLARHGRAVLIAGRSGAGKSTLSLALARCGLDYLSDDLVFLRPQADAAPQVLGFADVVGVTEATARLIPELAAPCHSDRDAGFPKHLVRVEEIFGTRIINASRPHILVFPEIVADGPSALDQMDPGEAWLRLVPDVLLTDEESSQGHLSAIAGLINHVSCYRLRGGPDVAASARLIYDLV